ncbi:MAG: hypothetical protein ACEQSB_06555, partial [Undibacterium sp.]
LSHPLMGGDIDIRPLVDGEGLEDIQRVGVESRGGPFEHFDFDARLTKYDEKEYKSRKITLIIPDTLIQFFRTRKNDLNRFALLFRHESIVEDMIFDYSKNPADKIAEYLAESPKIAEAVDTLKSNGAKVIRSPLPPEKD